MMIVRTQIPNDHRKALLSKYSSRQNKLWLIAGWAYFHHWYIEFKWVGDPYSSRILFQFEPNGAWIEAKSYDEDILPKCKFGKDNKKV